MAKLKKNFHLEVFFAFLEEQMETPFQIKF